MYYKALLLIGGAQHIVTNDIKNWDVLMAAYKRNNYDAIMRTFASQFEFVNGAYALLKYEYQRNYLNFSASIAIQARNNSWTYNTVFQCGLDVSSYVDSEEMITIDGLDDSVTSLIKAKNSIEYEFPVSEIKDSAQLEYDGIMLKNKVNWILAGSEGNDGEDVVTVKTDITYKSLYYAPLYVENKDALIKNNIEYSNQEEGLKPFSNDIFFIKANNKCTIVLNLEFDAKVDAPSVGGALYVRVNSTGIYKYDFTRNYRSFSLINQNIELNEGDALSITLSGSTSESTTCRFKNFKLTTEWGDRIPNPVNIDCIPATTLLNRILLAMKPTGELVGSISMDNTPVIVASESIRGIADAKIYTSLSKFREWMETVFGYVMRVNGNSIFFQKREDLFFKNNKAKEIDLYNNFAYNIEKSLIYSSVVIGYDKQDYGEVNGRDEFRFSETWETGVTVGSSTLTLKSPYRADSYGFEFLAQKRGADTTDSSSDKNIFFIKAIFDAAGGKYTLDRSVPITGVLSPETMFNAMFSPRACLEANKGFIGACTSSLKFASSEANSEVTINGVPETNAVTVSEDERIFKVGEISFETPETDIPSNWFGYVEIANKGDVYRGYIKSTEVNYGREQSVKYTLIEI